jgi:hypothetical protein
LDKVVIILKDLKEKRIEIEDYTDYLQIADTLKPISPKTGSFKKQGIQAPRYLQEEFGIGPNLL